MGRARGPVTRSHARHTDQRRDSIGEILDFPNSADRGVGTDPEALIGSKSSDNFVKNGEREHVPPKGGPPSQMAHPQRQ
jgi:hypothetical protein